MNNSIVVMDTVEWSKLKWDESWEKIADIESLLPQIGESYVLPVVYPGPLCRKPPKNGDTSIVWKPPHSDLNGWADKRPSEILKSYIIEGELRTLSPESKYFHFIVSNREKLISVFERLEECDDPLTHDSPFNLGWDKADRLSHFEVGKYSYIFGGYGESWLEAILSRDKEKLCLHYSASLHPPSLSNVVITRSNLTGADRKIIESVIKRAQKINDASMNEITDNQVFGAEYW